MAAKETAEEELGEYEQNWYFPINWLVS
jgi:hypothetical protein